MKYQSAVKLIAIAIISVYIVQFPNLTLNLGLGTQLAFLLNTESIINLFLLDYLLLQLIVFVYPKQKKNRNKLRNILPIVLIFIIFAAINIIYLFPNGNTFSSYLSISLKLEELSLITILLILFSKIKNKINYLIIPVTIFVLLLLQNTVGSWFIFILANLFNTSVSKVCTINQEAYLNSTNGLFIIDSILGGIIGLFLVHIVGEIKKKRNNKDDEKTPHIKITINTLNLGLIFILLIIGIVLSVVMIGNLLYTISIYGLQQQTLLIVSSNNSIYNQTQINNITCSRAEALNPDIQSGLATALEIVSILLGIIIATSVSYAIYKNS